MNPIQDTTKETYNLGMSVLVLVYIGLIYIGIGLFLWSLFLVS